VIGTSLYLLSKFGLDAMDVDIHFLHRLCVAFFATIFSMLILSRKYPNRKEFTIQNKGIVDGKNWKYVKPVSLLVVVLTVLVYLLFSPLLT
jgi:SSS family solute:Na+ symporter